MAFIVSATLRHALNSHSKLKKKPLENYWITNMLLPEDFSPKSLKDPVIRNLMSKIEFKHGGPEYDAKYPEGIPTSIQIETSSKKVFDSGFIMFPPGHARYDETVTFNILKQKHKNLGLLGLGKSTLSSMIEKMGSIEKLSNEEVGNLYNAKILFSEKSIDE